jgi:hypothetical protein
MNSGNGSIRAVSQARCRRQRRSFHDQVIQRPNLAWLERSFAPGRSQIQRLLAEVEEYPRA